MPGKKVSWHPLEKLNGLRGVQGITNTLAWLAEELSSRNEIRILQVFRAEDLWRSQESRGERGLGQVCCKSTTQSATNSRTGAVAGYIGF